MRSPRIDLATRRGVQEMVLSVKHLDRATAVYTEVAQFVVKAAGLADPRLAVAWGLPADTRIEERLLGLPNDDRSLLRLVRIHATGQVQIRSSARPFDTGGIFNINSLVKDIDVVFEALRDHGFQGFADPNRYTLFGKPYAGAMLRGHDGVVINLLQRVDQPYDDLPPFATMSPIRNATQVVADFSASRRFFTEQLGWTTRWEASPTWPPDGSNNMGIPNSVVRSGQVTERAASFALSDDADGGSVEIFAFEGLTGRDYADRAHPPNYGILSYRVHVPNLDDYLRAIRARGVALHRSVTRLTIAPYGAVTHAVVRAPDGAWLEFFEQEPA
ncbi:MAG: hypothetical protein NZ518_02565 [Dehalococcoidia bacterium]|nr:hypothetical protein [Dehalococcoidia bacterium]